MWEKVKAWFGYVDERADLSSRGRAFEYNGGRFDELLHNKHVHLPNGLVEPNPSPYISPMPELIKERDANRRKQD